MDYLTTAEAAKLWGISSRRVLNLARDGRIPGVKQIGSRWMIPRGSNKPIDGRTKVGKNSAINNFRYPYFEFKDEGSFNPPLSKEEKILKTATEYFHRCKYEEANNALEKLDETAKDKLILIAAIYTRCMIDIYICDTSKFHIHYKKLITILDGDYPCKKEMTEYVHIIDSALGYDKYYAEDFKIDPTYRYSEEFLPRLANLSSLPLTFAQTDLNEASIRAHELNCVNLERTDAYVDLQALHINVGTAYGLMKDQERSFYHLRRALELAEKYGMYYQVAIQYYYAQKLFKPALYGFSKEFIAKINRLSRDTHRRCKVFMSKLPALNIYSLLSNNDYIFIHYAMQGMSNKDVADLLHVSVGNVGKKYGEIYASFGVKNKGEIVRLLKEGIEKQLGMP